MKPILKWAGGKSSILKFIKKYLPPNLDQRMYYEPFFGSGALFFDIKPNKGVISDINKKLINFYDVIKNYPDKLIAKAVKYEKYNTNSKKYYEFREIFNKQKLDNIESAALFLYLNKTCYNGLYRENSNGQFNVPIGRYKNPKIVNKMKIKEASKILKNIDMVSNDFQFIEKIVKPGDICYFDPPYYQPEINNKFTSYSKEGFNYNDHMRLKNLCVKLNDIGAYFILSNANNSEIINLYKKEKFEIVSITKKWMISCNVETRKNAEEIIILNTNSF